MKANLVLLIAVLGVALACASCGSGAANSGAASAGRYLKNDGDRDIDDENKNDESFENDDRSLLASYGSKAKSADAREVASVVKSYYAAAATSDGTKACELLSVSIGAGLAASQGPSTANEGRRCASGAADLFKEQHQRLVRDNVTTMMVTSVRVKGDLGLAVLGFKTVPEGEILVQREGRAWRIADLLDSQMP